MFLFLSYISMQERLVNKKGKMSRKRLRGEEVLQRLEEITSESDDNDSSMESSNTELYELNEPSAFDDEEMVDSDEDDDAADDAADASSTAGWQQMRPNHPPFPVQPFSVGSAGPQLTADLETELDFFKLFFNDELVSDIVEETNRYAK